MKRIMIVEDEAAIREFEAINLKRVGYSVVEAGSGEEALDIYDSDTEGIDIALLDISMPGMDGFELVQSVRSVNRTIPILLMTARDDLAAKQRGFRAGIDDYMVKPIEVDELLLRIEALLRRARIEQENRLVVGKTVLDAQEMSAYVDGTEVPLTVREFNILYKLLSYPRRTFSRAQLMDEFWSGETSASLRAVDVYITRIREKFSSSEDFRIVTVHGLGYKAVPAV